MLHIYMLRYSSFIQVKCNWYRMGTIVLTVKRNDCKTPEPKASSRLTLRKNCSSNPITNLTSKKEHLLHSNLLSNHTEVRRSPTDLQDAKNHFPKDNKL